MESVSVTSDQSIKSSPALPMIVAIDGPAGSGKSSVCTKACEKMGWSYLNTGALYRAIAYLGVKNHADLSDEQAVLEIVDMLAQDFVWDSVHNKLLYRGQSLSAFIYTEEIGNLASKIARLEHVRERLIPLQRDLIYSSKTTILVDGRDIGTVIVPECPLKVFMTASLETRAKRRLKQLVDAGKSSQEESAARVMADIERRDVQDQQRAVAPLAQASDAVLFDTSHMSQSEAIQGLIDLVVSKQQKV